MVTLQKEMEELKKKFHEIDELKLEVEEYRTLKDRLWKIKDLEGTGKNMVTIDEISQQCQAAKDYVSKIDRNFNELKECCNECLQ